MTTLHDRPSLDPAVLREVHQIEHRSLGRIAVFLLLYIAGAGGALALTTALGGGWGAIVACLPLYLLAAASLHGISLFTHEGVHGVLSKNEAVNRAISIACALPVLQTFTAYRVLHLKHHKNLGAEGDPDHYPNYTTWSPLIWAMHWGRLLLGYPAYVTAIPVLGFLQGKAKDRFWIMFEVALLLGWIAFLIWGPVPWSILLHVWLLPMLLINTLVNVRGMSQHTLLEDATDVICGTRSLLTGRVVTFFMCNENFHLEHHLYPGVPWVHLPRVHRLLRDELLQRGAPFVPSYSSFVWDFIRASLRLRPVGSVSLRDLRPSSEPPPDV